VPIQEKGSSTEIGTEKSLVGKRMSSMTIIVAKLEHAAWEARCVFSFEPPYQRYTRIWCTTKLLVFVAPMAVSFVLDLSVEDFR
jgi:hypothetical protein